MLAQAQTTAEQTHREARRVRKLADVGTIDLQAAERAELAWKRAREELDAARAAVVQAQQRLADARLGPQRIRAKKAELAAAIATEREAEARLAEAQSTLDDLTIVSPGPGTVTTRLVDLGEVVSAGTPLLELVDLGQLYLKVYIPAVQIGKVRLGIPAHIYTDAFPHQAFAATVRYIASQAEFTPKEIQTPDERVKLVYAVKLYLDAHPEYRLTPGLPADAVLRWKEDTPWRKPRW
jgi:HlyD family secretion protein